MNPELKKYGDLVGYKQNNGMKADQRHGQEEDQLDVLHPAQPERNGKVIVFAGVMRDVRRPPEALLVGDPVCPITA